MSLLEKVRNKKVAAMQDRMSFCEQYMKNEIGHELFKLAQGNYEFREYLFGDSEIKLPFGGIRGKGPLPVLDYLCWVQFCKNSMVPIYPFKKEIVWDNYSTYLKTTSWRGKTFDVRRGHECHLCENTIGVLINNNIEPLPMHTHHLTYMNIYNELPHELISLCSACHKFIHRLSKIDVFSFLSPYYPHAEDSINLILKFIKNISKKLIRENQAVIDSLIYDGRNGDVYPEWYEGYLPAEKEYTAYSHLLGRYEDSIGYVDKKLGLLEVNDQICAFKPVVFKDIVDITGVI